jgi:hypothetical protein
VSVFVRQHVCLRCGHQWYGRKPELPVACPNRKCHSPYWNTPRRRPGAPTSAQIRAALAKKPREVKAPVLFCERCQREGYAIGCPTCIALRQEARAAQGQAAGAAPPAPAMPLFCERCQRVGPITYCKACAALRQARQAEGAASSAPPVGPPETPPDRDAHG